MLSNVLSLCIGDKALRQILDDARKVADRCTNRQDRDTIMKSVGDIESMSNALSELRQQGKVCVDAVCFHVLCPCTTH